jgi:hypothetical protein
MNPFTYELSKTELIGLEWVAAKSDLTADEYLRARVAEILSSYNEIEQRESLAAGLEAYKNADTETKAKVKAALGL